MHGSSLEARNRGSLGKIKYSSATLGSRHLNCLHVQIHHSFLGGGVLLLYSDKVPQEQTGSQHVHGIKAT